MSTWTPATVTLTWGEEIKRLVSRSGGMPQVVQRLHRVLRRLAASRATYESLYTLDDPTSLTPERAWYATQVLYALGADPEEWGVPTPDVPEWAIRALKQMGTPPRGRASQLPRQDSNLKPAGYGSLSRRRQNITRLAPRVAA